MRTDGSGRSVVLCLLFLAIAGTAYAADSPFVGKWKLNLARSEFAGATLAFEPTAAGDMTLAADGQTYTFRMDGKDYATPSKYVAAWTQVDAATWQTVYKLPKGGAVVYTDTITLSADGKTLTVTSRGTMPSGETFENVVAYQRTSGEGGLTGKWKSTKVQLSSPETMELAPYDGDGLRWSYPEWKVTFSLKLDGKDTPVTGPTVPPGVSVAMIKADSRSFDLLQKLDGKVVNRGTYTLSADGKTLTVVFAAEGTQEKVKVVYDRQ